MIDSFGPIGRYRPGTTGRNEEREKGGGGAARAPYGRVKAGNRGQGQ